MVNQFLSQEYLWGRSTALAVLDQFQNYRETLNNEPNLAFLRVSKSECLSASGGRASLIPWLGALLLESPQTPVIGSRKALAITLLLQTEFMEPPLIRESFSEFQAKKFEYSYVTIIGLWFQDRLPRNPKQWAKFSFPKGIKKWMSFSFRGEGFSDPLTRRSAPGEPPDPDYRITQSARDHPPPNRIYGAATDTRVVQWVTSKEIWI